MCRAAPGGAKTGIAAFQAARMTSAFRRAPRVPFRTDEKEPKVRLRGLHRPLRDPLEHLAITRRLPPLPTGTQAEGSIQVADAPNNAHRMARGDPPSGKQRPYRAFARSERVRGVAAQFSAFPWALRAMQKRTCLPGSTSGTVPETLRQRHCARGAAAGGMLWARPLIRDRAPPTLAAGQPEAARRSRGHGPLRLLSPISCPYKKWGRLPGRDPASYAAH